MPGIWGSDGNRTIINYDDDDNGNENYDDNDDAHDIFLPTPTPGIERFFLMVYALAFGLVSSVYLWPELLKVILPPGSGMSTVSTWDNHHHRSVSETYMRNTINPSLRVPSYVPKSFSFVYWNLFGLILFSTVLVVPKVTWEKKVQ